VRGVLVHAMSGTELSRVRTEFRLRLPEPINKSTPETRGPTLLCNQVVSGRRRVFSAREAGPFRGWWPPRGKASAQNILLLKFFDGLCFSFSILEERLKFFIRGRHSSRVFPSSSRVVGAFPPYALCHKRKSPRLAAAF
jgi:hypothetical protein